MSAPVHQHDPGPAISGNDGQDEGHGGHSLWLMVACCIPLLLALALIAVGR